MNGNLKGEPDILFLPSQTTNYSEFILKAISESTHEYFVWLRPHPVEQHQEKDYEFLLKRYNLQGKVDFETDLYDQLRSSDLVVGVHTTVLLEALIANKPILHCPYLQEGNNNCFSNGKLDLCECNSEKKLIEALNDPLGYYLKRAKGKTFNKIISKFVYDNAYKQDGKATERCVKVINDMLRE